MQGTALGHRLETLQDGLTTFRNGVQAPMPLLRTEIDIRVMAGLAIVRTNRSFRNAEDAPIEAILTFPVGFDAVVTALAATIDGRRMLGVAKEKSEARITYEAALDEGRLSVLHEEALRGIHVLSVGALPPSAEVAIELEQVIPLTNSGGTPFLRLPMTAGQVYGTSPLLPADDLVTAQGVHHKAVLSVTTDAGQAVLGGQILEPDAQTTVILDRAIELRIEGGAFSTLKGRSADGHVVEVSLSADAAAEQPLDLHVLVDRSGSTGSPVRENRMSIWDAMRSGLLAEFARLGAKDRITFWQFDDQCQCLGSAKGTSALRMAERLVRPGGGTELAGAIRAALGKGARDLLVLTDGQTWAHMVEELKSEGPRVSAILVGPNSLDANIGHLCAITGGQVLFAPGSDVASSLRSAFHTLRNPARAVEGEVSSDAPAWLTAMRGGVSIGVTWDQTDEPDGDAVEYAIGRFAAALALPLLATAASEAWSRKHSLCTHATSLVLVDAVGEAVEGFSQMRKIPLMDGDDGLIASPGSRSICAPLVSAMPAPTNSAHHGIVDAMSADAPSVHDRLADSIPIVLHKVASPQTARHAQNRLSYAPSAKPLSPAKIGLLTRLLAVLKRRKVRTLEQIFANFRWDAFGDQLIKGNFDCLTKEQSEAVEQCEMRILRHCFEGGHEDTLPSGLNVVALGMIARKINNRLAERFAKRALKGAPVWLTEWQE